MHKVLRILPTLISGIIFITTTTSIGTGTTITSNTITMQTWSDGLEEEALKRACMIRGWEQVRRIDK